MSSASALPPTVAAPLATAVGGGATTTAPAAPAPATSAQAEIQAISATLTGSLLPALQALIAAISGGGALGGGAVQGAVTQGAVPTQVFSPAQTLVQTYGGGPVPDVLTGSNGLGTVPTPTSTPTPTATVPTPTTTPAKATVSTSKAALDTQLKAAYGTAKVPIHEVGLPSGAYAGKAPRGVVMVSHGGGWKDNGQGRVDSMDADAKAWNARGYVTVNVDYEAGTKGLADTLKTYDAIRKWQGADVPIGALGSSSGANLSLLLAAKRPDVAFVVGHGAPTDLSTLNTKLETQATTQLGAKNLAAFSPVAQAGSIKAQVLLAGGVTDPLVPTTQMDELKAKLPNTQVLKLAKGTSTFTHTTVSAASLKSLSSAEDALANTFAI